MCELHNDPFSLYGLIPNDNIGYNFNPELFFDKALLKSGIKIITASDIEVELSQRKHRRKRNNVLLEKMFTSFAKKIVEFEIDTLKLFGLPNIDEIERVISDFDYEYPELSTIELNAKKKNAYKRIVNELSEDFTGKKDLIKKVSLDDLSLFQYYILNQFSATTEYVFQDILDSLPDDLDEGLLNTIMSSRIAPVLDNVYLKKMIDKGGKRISTQLANDYFQDTYQTLVQMVKEGKDPYTMGGYLHKKVGKGKLWYWRRITRSESVLAMNSAFKAQSIASKVQYEVWSAALNACEICQGFDGLMWRLGEGPEPVSSTHPHCMCFKFPRYLTDGTAVMRSWNRSTPYDRPYSLEDVQALRPDLTNNPLIGGSIPAPRNFIP